MNDAVNSSKAADHLVKDALHLPKAALFSANAALPLSQTAHLLPS
jgi:hypothetical protein